MPNITTPVYSHLIYNIIPNGNKTIIQPNILILKKLNILQNKINYPHNPHHIFISNFVNFSIYINTPKNLLQT